MALIVPQTNIATRLAIQKSKAAVFNNLTVNGLLYYGEGRIKSLGAATNGQLPIGSTGVPPVLAEITGTANQVISTPGAGSITLSLPQDIHTGASPTFANLNLGTGELTTGSINRASGTLTLEIGGTAELSITSSVSTFGGNIIIPDAGNIGSVSDIDAIVIASGGEVTLSQTLLLSDVINAATDTDKFLVLDASNNVDFRTGAEVLSDIGASSTSHQHDTDTLQHDAVNSDGGAFSFTTTGLVTFNQSIASANYAAANLLTAAATNAGELDFTAGSKKLDVEDDAVVSQDYTSDAVPTFAGAVLSGTTAIGLDMSGGTFATAAILIPDGAHIGSASDTDAIQIEADGDVVLTSNFDLADTTTSALGVVTKGGTRFLHNFHHPTGDSAIPTGFNVFVGELAGNFTMGSTATSTDHASYNVGLGQNSLNNNTTGSFNFGLGRSALQQNTTGSRNIGLGINALFQNTTGFGNVGIGYFAGRYNQTGNYNTIVGYQAGVGNANQSFSENVLIGREAGFDLTTGSSNIIIGFKAGHKQSTASNILIIDNQLRASAAADITDCPIYGTFNATPASQTLRFNVGNLYLGNPTHSDADGGGAIIQSFIREDGSGTASTAATITVSHDGAGADDTDGKLVIATNLEGTGLVDNLMIQNTGDWVVNKTSGVGIKVDLAAPTFGFADLLGDVTVKNTGGSRPALIAYRDGLLEFEFAAGEEEYFKYHIPHDYVKGTDIFLHFHWSTNGALVNGGTVTFEYEISYAKAHAQAAFPASVSGTIVSATASSTQYTQELTEVQISASTPSGSQIDTDDLEPDGIIICTAGTNANNLTVSSGGVPDPFIHYVDIHYQTTGIIGTKAKAPDFYV